MGQADGKINKMAEGVMKIADSDITYKSSHVIRAETTANGWPDGRYSIGVNIGAGIVHRGSRAEMADVTD